MPCTVDELKLINRSLRRFGAGTIMSVDEDTELADQAIPAYEDMRDLALGAYHWKWPRKVRRLDQLVNDVSETTLAADGTTVVPIAYRNTFNFPAGAVGGPEALFVSPLRPQDRLRNFMVEGTTVRANVDQLFGVFNLAQDVSIWPAIYRVALQTWLSGIYALSISHDKDLHDSLVAAAIGTPSDKMQGGLMGRAIGIDASTAGGVAPIGVDDTLTGAHFGSGGNWWGGDHGW